jgi:hypothetical protein
MDYYFRDHSFSPLPQPRRKSFRTIQSSEINCLILNNHSTYTHASVEPSFVPIHNICETPRTMPRKPRKPKLTHTTQNHNSSDQSVFTPIITRPSTATSFNYENTPKLKRPNAPPPPLPLPARPSGPFESTMIDSLPGYYKINYSKTVKTARSDFSSSEFMDSTFSCSNFSTPKLSRTDLLFTQSNSTANLINDKPKDTNFKLNNKKSYNQYHIGFRNFEAEFVNPLKKQSNNYAPTTYNLSHKNKVFSFFKKLTKTLCPSSPGSFFNDSLFNYIVFFLGKTINTI